MHNVAVDGSFDDCQDFVKDLFGDADIKRTHQLAAVNSINWARILAQMYVRSIFSTNTQTHEANSSGLLLNLTINHQDVFS